MKLVNETNVAVNYWITASNGQAECGEIAVDGLADLPGYDNLQNVVVEFLPVGDVAYFATTWDATQTDEQTQILLVAE
jgi:hypothetical protein